MTVKPSEFPEDSAKTDGTIEFSLLSVPRVYAWHRLESLAYGLTPFKKREITFLYEALRGDSGGIVLLHIVVVNMEATVPDSNQASFAPEEKTSPGVGGKERRLNDSGPNARYFSTVAFPSFRQIRPHRDTSHDIAIARGGRGEARLSEGTLFRGIKLCSILCPLSITNHSNWAHSGREMSRLYWCGKSQSQQVNLNHASTGNRRTLNWYDCYMFSTGATSYDGASVAKDCMRRKGRSG
jgi:hypothetical protein